MEEIKQQLKEIIKELSQELVQVREENEALWFMLEEIKESDKAVKKSLDNQREILLMKLLAGHGPVGEA